MTGKTRAFAGLDDSLRGWHGYEGLAAAGYPQHCPVVHRGWVLVDRRRGIRLPYLHLHLKECEIRFNHRRQNLYRLLLRLRTTPPLE